MPDMLWRVQLLVLAIHASPQRRQARKRAIQHDSMRLIWTCVSSASSCLLSSWLLQSLAF